MGDSSRMDMMMISEMMLYADDDLMKAPVCVLCKDKSMAYRSFHDFWWISKDVEVESVEFTKTCITFKFRLNSKEVLK